MSLLDKILSQTKETEMKKYRSWVVVSDVHAPWHDKRIHAAILDFLSDFKPDGFIIDGDFMDFYSVSRHLKGINDLENPENKHIIRLNDEFLMGCGVLNDYDKHLPKNCEKHFLEGNHEFRLTRWFNEAMNGVLSGLISVDGNLELKEKGYKYHEGYPNNYITIGRLIVTHGNWTPIYTAAKHLNEFRGSVLFGHTHTSQLHYVGGLKNKQAGFNIGHLADVNAKGMSYAKKTGRWVHGFGIVYEEVSTGKFWVELLNFYDHKLFYNKKMYGG